MSASTSPRSVQAQPEILTREPMTCWFSPTQLIQTGLKTLVSTLFGTYLDRREIEAALDREGPDAEAARLDFSNQPDLWLDYVADNGDGWDSTYAVAYLLGKPSLSAQGQSVPRGKILVMGGDQVYPTASVTDYQTKLKNPYRAAMPYVPSEDPPRMFAIPGNHDWYDGLSGFLKVFCQSRWIGAWKTSQRRSYFVLRLPGPWWLWAVDIQLETDLDRPQLDYFEFFANKLKLGDRVILCTPTSSWIDAAKQALGPWKESHAHRNLNLLERWVRKRGAQVVLNLAGDLHHYSHYVSQNDARHKFTAGGGGAFLLGTNELPKDLQLDEGTGLSKYTQRQVFPDAGTSSRLRWGALGFIAKNPSLAWLLGGLGVFVAWVLQAASRSSATSPGSTLLDVLSTASFDTSGWCRGWEVLYGSLVSSPGICLLLAGLATAFSGLAYSDSLLTRQLRGAIWGLGHGILQVAMTLCLIWCSSILTWRLLPSFWPGLAPYLVPGSVSLGGQVLAALLFTLELLVGGFLVNGTLMGVNLTLGSVLLGIYSEFVFSSQSIPDYKNFLRIHIEREHVTVYSFGIGQVPKDWKLGDGVTSLPADSRNQWKLRPAPTQEGKPWIEPSNGTVDYFLIEPPVEISSQGESGS